MSGVSVAFFAVEIMRKSCENDNHYHILKSEIDLYHNAKSMKTANHSQELILTLLGVISTPLSAQDIWAELQKQGQKLGIATIYRNLELLKLKGLVQVRTIHNEAFYSLVAGDQYFATCLHCGERMPLENSLCGSLQVSTLQPHFRAYYHTLEVFGLCSPCKSESPI